MCLVFAFAPLWYGNNCVKVSIEPLGAISLNLTPTITKHNIFAAFMHWPNETGYLIVLLIDLHI